MKLMTKALKNSLPKLYAQDGAKDPVVPAKFFNPCGSGTWYATEFDGEDTFFGWVDLGFHSEAELGYFSLKEFENFRGPLGIGIERDLYFSKRPLSEVKGGF